uniref:OSJNBa0029H02.16 protein n=1 Tax=Oryza sativa subsp. japonica TaxID=39947 RepID=Q7XT75_ORYSJ|nr:OSJNBa0029H02.16 [Oryza sativa Japonica Group]
MGSSIGRATIFYCVALSIIAGAAATQVPPTEAESVEAPVCPVRFDKMKGPAIELGKKCKTTGVKVCCEAFKTFACPHNKLINDVNNGCADEMFYTIHTYGQLLPGTIFKKCLEGPHGMKC